MMNKQGVGATAFDMPNDQKPKDYPRKIHYGNTHVPRPTNSSAKVVDHAKVMTQILHGK